LPTPDPGQGHFSWSLTVNDDPPIPARQIFGRRLLTVNGLADIIPERSKFSGILGMPIISSTAMKGGPGKSTLCHMLLGALGLTGRRILAIDNDPQSSLSTGLLGTEIEQYPIDSTIWAIMAGKDPLPEDVIRPSGIVGVDLVPGSRAVDPFNMPEPHLAPAEVQSRLRSFLDEVRGDYALVLIDNPPNLYGCTYASLVAADYAIIPCIPQNYDVSSLSPVLEIIRQVAAGPNPSLVNLGVILNRVKRTSVHGAFERTLREIHGPLIFETKVAESTDIPDAIVVNKPVTHYKPRGASAKSIKILADEIVARIAAHEGSGAGVELMEVGANG